MTVEKIITQVQDEKPNQFDYGKLMDWLNVIEARIYKEVICRITGEDPDDYVNITEDQGSRELLAKEPYHELYVFYLFSRIDFINQEMDRYGNSAAMFNQTFQDFANEFHRTHTPANKSILRIWK